MPAPKGNKNRQKGLNPRDAQINVRMTKELKQKVELHAESMGVTKTELLESIIVKYFSMKDEK